MINPADEIRAASTRLRTRATAATPGTWRAEELPPDDTHARPAHWVNTEYNVGDGFTTVETVADCPWRQADADYIAAMHPGVGTALAAWLEWEAETVSRTAWAPINGGLDRALAVARAISGGEQP
ncbi:hypothetical protein ACIQNU_04110 [Streptomyces sp. NPDC091292]|uniref:hypothetical protein n=1 Tax=Streptomyces sp. NPDC091292 TaxID=3365991 RepID=UPI00380572AC